MDTQTPDARFGPVRPRHVIMLLTLATVWGTSFLTIKIGVDFMSGLTLTAIRLVVAAAAVLIVALVTRTAWPTGGKIWAYCFALGLFGNSLPFFLISWGEEGIDSGRAAILIAVMPLTTLVLSHFLVKGDRLTLAKLFGVILGFVGIVVLVGPAALTDEGGRVLHQLAVAGGAICYAVTVIIIRHMPPTPIIGRAALTHVLAAAQIVPVTLWIDGGVLPPMTFEALWTPVYLGLFPTAMATLVLFKLSSEREPSFIAFQNYLVPIFGVFWGALLLNEVVTPQVLAALGLILGGIFFANRPNRG
jgi:drug/metabolite transporter (DMT)-like permease